MSRFISGGSLDQPVERDEEWAKAEQELEEERKRKADLDKQHAGKSLYEVLQANKAAKQEAFEESIRLKNQFRALDDDEADFLDTVLENERAKEQAVKKETNAQLAAFRKLRDDAERQTLGATSAAATAVDEEHDWALAGRKRKKQPEKDGIRGLKLRKTSTKSEDSGPKQPPANPAKKIDASPEKSPPARSPTTGGSKANSKPMPASLGLAAYSSDDDEVEDGDG